MLGAAPTEAPGHMELRIQEVQGERVVARPFSGRSLHDLALVAVQRRAQKGRAEPWIDALGFTSLIEYFGVACRALFAGLAGDSVRGAPIGCDVTNRATASPVRLRAQRRLEFARWRL